ncbi:MAG: nucleotide exchange factor GrpE [Rhodobacteraceae bacterium]|nr:nucleotide exchange factor GrpE [Paracoccaceae bacterium]
MTAKDQPEETVDMTNGRGEDLDDVASAHSPEETPVGEPPLETDVNPVDIPDVQKEAAPDVQDESVAADGGAWQPARTDGGPVDGETYAALLKAYDDAVARMGELGTSHAVLTEEYDQCMRNLANRTDEIVRLKKQIDGIRKYGAQDLGRDILSTFDNLDRALGIARSDEIGDTAAFIDGIETLFRDFRSTLERHGIQRVAPQEGDTLDPNLHEAMYHVPDERFGAGQILSVDQIGFMLHDRLLRPARVGVASAPVVAEPDTA